MEDWGRHLLAQRAGRWCPGRPGECRGGVGRGAERGVVRLVRHLIPGSYPVGGAPVVVVGVSPASYGGCLPVASLRGLGLGLGLCTTRHLRVEEGEVHDARDLGPDDNRGVVLRCLDIGESSGSDCGSGGVGKECLVPDVCDVGLEPLDDEVKLGDGGFGHSQPAGYHHEALDLLGGECRVLVWRCHLGSDVGLDLLELGDPPHQARLELVDERHSRCVLHVVGLSILELLWLSEQCASLVPGDLQISHWYTSMVAVLLEFFLSSGA